VTGGCRNGSERRGADNLPAVAPTDLVSLVPVNRPRVLSNPAWQDIFSRVPEGMASYLRIEPKFADSLM